MLSRNLVVLCVRVEKVNNIFIHYSICWGGKNCLHIKYIHILYPIHLAFKRNIEREEFVFKICALSKPLLRAYLKEETSGV